MSGCLLQLEWSPDLACWWWDLLSAGGPLGAVGVFEELGTGGTRRALRLPVQPQSSLAPFFHWVVQVNVISPWSNPYEYQQCARHYSVTTVGSTQPNPKAPLCELCGVASRGSPDCLGEYRRLGILWQQISSACVQCVSIRTPISVPFLKALAARGLAKVWTNCGAWSWRLQRPSEWALNHRSAEIKIDDKKDLDNSMNNNDNTNNDMQQQQQQQQQQGHDELIPCSPPGWLVFLRWSLNHTYLIPHVTQTPRAM
eukprot:1313558-Amphidinium_carterae.1